MSQSLKWESSISAAIVLALPASCLLVATSGDAARIIGARPNDHCGEEIWSADLNGDGFKDLMIGSIISEGSARRPFAGACFLAQAKGQWL
jgi:hypothetical protein